MIIGTFITKKENIYTIFDTICGYDCPLKRRYENDLNFMDSYLWENNSFLIEDPCNYCHSHECDDELFWGYYGYSITKTGIEHIGNSISKLREQDFDYILRISDDDFESLIKFIKNKIYSARDSITELYSIDKSLAKSNYSFVNYLFKQFCFNIIDEEGEYTIFAADLCDEYRLDFSWIHHKYRYLTRNPFADESERIGDPILNKYDMLPESSYNYISELTLNRCHQIIENTITACYNNAKILFERKLKENSNKID